MTIEEKYQELLRTPSDISFHLPILREYADRCDHVTEMGVRCGFSLHAFLSSKASKVVAYDINDVSVPNSEKLTFICADVLRVDIDPTDFLFIDTLHTYDQLICELARHAAKAGTYIGFHDTVLFGQKGEDGKEPSLLAAIEEFLSVNPSWSICYQSDEQNGLMIIQKCSVQS